MTNQTFSRSVPVPNSLFDEYIPTLTDTELRVLLVVIRATLGWREADGQGNTRYKTRDWINHAQLQRRTGRSSAAISRAVQSLVERSLIHVENWRGEPLTTADVRRSHIGKMYYRLGPVWKTPPQRDIAKVSTTTYSTYNKQSAKAVDNSHEKGPGAMRSSASGFERIATILDNLAEPRGRE